MWNGFDPHICSPRAPPPARASGPRSPLLYELSGCSFRGARLGGGSGGVEQTMHGMGFGQSEQEEKALRIQARLSLATAR